MHLLQSDAITDAQQLVDSRIVLEEDEGGAPAIKRGSVRRRGGEALSIGLHRAHALLEALRASAASRRRGRAWLRCSRTAAVVEFVGPERRIAQLFDLQAVGAGAREAVGPTRGADEAHTSSAGLWMGAHALWLQKRGKPSARPC